MDYVLWFPKCKVRAPLVESLSNARSIDLVRFVAWSSVLDPVRFESRVCPCHTCKSECSFFLVRCSERCLDTGLDAEPVLVERTRHSPACSRNVFVNYSFAHPPTLDRDALLRILSDAGAILLYVCSTFDTVTGTEESSVLKVNLVRYKTPGCERDTEWLAERIRAATFCRARKFEVRYVTYLPQLGNEYGRSLVHSDAETLHERARVTTRDLLASGSPS